MPPRRAAQMCRPYGGCRSGYFFLVGPVPDRPAGIRTGRDGSVKPGAGVKPHCPQFSTSIGRRRRPPTQSPAKRVCVGEEERWSERALPDPGEARDTKSATTKGPVARREFRHSLRFPRAGNFTHPNRCASPVTGVWGRLLLSGGDGPKGQRG